MKDARIWDGSAWQSLRGPEGPSQPSADDGNIIMLGSDGLLAVQGETQFSGEWTPLFTYGDADDLDNVCAGYWTRAGRLVTVFIGVSSAEATNVTEGSVLLGLPFAPAEAFHQNAVSRATFGGVVIDVFGNIIGTLSLGDKSVEFVMKLDNPTATADGFSVSVTYLTDDPPVRGTL